jgi:hypothetical protein
MPHRSRCCAYLRCIRRSPSRCWRPPSNSFARALRTIPGGL